MTNEDYSIETVLDSIELMMPSLKQPKVLLFDIGGVCVISPFQAILDYELSHNIPPGWVNHCISKTKPHGFWHRLERGELLMNSQWFAGFSSDLHRQDLWEDFYNTQAKKNSLSSQIPPLPKVDAEWVFWEMMRVSREPDPWMHPALVALKASGKYIMAALSNTVIFPPSHPYSDSSHQELRTIFDVFISSAHVGLRKPDPAIYDLALKEVDRFSREKGKGSVGAGDVLFLDDIGENLKAGKMKGFRTMKVNLGRAFEAVDELEEVTGLKIAGTHPRIPMEPKISKARL